MMRRECVCVWERERERPGRVKSRIELERWKKERRPDIKRTWLAPITISSTPLFHTNRPLAVCISSTHSLFHLFSLSFSLSLSLSLSLSPSLSLSLSHSLFISCSKILRTYYVCFCSLVEFYKIIISVSPPPSLSLSLSLSLLSLSLSLSLSLFPSLFICFFWLDTIKNSPHYLMYVFLVCHSSAGIWCTVPLLSNLEKVYMCIWVSKYLNV